VALRTITSESIKVIYMACWPSNLVVQFFFFSWTKCFLDHEINLSTSVPSQNTFRRWSKSVKIQFPTKRRQLSTHSLAWKSCLSRVLVKKIKSTRAVIPVIMLASSDAKKDTKLATSSGVVSRPKGDTVSAIAASTWSCHTLGSYWVVLIQRRD